MLCFDWATAGTPPSCSQLLPVAPSLVPLLFSLAPNPPRLRDSQLLRSLDIALIKATGNGKRETGNGKVRVLVLMGTRN
jgi:hypothetical protein